MTPKQRLVEFNELQKELNLGDEVLLTTFSMKANSLVLSVPQKEKDSKVLLSATDSEGVGQATHGQHNRLSAPGSIGAASDPARVFKGMRMAGQMGNSRVYYRKPRST